ncbi:MAG: hypothetical protein HFJ51_01200 [Clostridia bacterium]|nr:hypothetical protein [Clostridia bacterium]
MINKQIEELLENTAKRGRVVNGYIFSGTKRTQTYEYAKKFAKMVLCLDNKADVCSSCKSCIMFDNENHPDYYELNKGIEDAIKIDEIREMQTKIYEKPIISSKKVYVINNAENMTKEAQNCLLKTLEEPPEFVTMIIISNNDNNILVTIKSRCAKVIFTEESNKELTEEENKVYNELERIFGHIQEYKSVDLLNKLEILYKNKEKIFEILEFVNIILFEKAKEDVSYLEYIDYVEEAKRKLKQNSNFDMCIDNLILKIWE